MDYELIKEHLKEFEKKVVGNPVPWHLYAYVQNSSLVKELKTIGNKAIPFFGKFLTEESSTQNELDTEPKRELREAWITLFVIFIVEFKVDKANQPSMFQPLEEWRKWSTSFKPDN